MEQQPERKINIDKLPDTSSIIEQIAKIRIRLTDQDYVELKKKDPARHRTTIEREFFPFWEKYPTLFKLIYKGEDTSRLAEMLCMIDKLKSKEVSVEQGEKELGESLAQKYLYPKFKNNK